MKRVEIFEAFDGFTFRSEFECRNYERRQSHEQLVGLGIADINAALSGENPELADAIETVGAKLARERVERGDLKRKRGVRDAAIEAPAMGDDVDVEAA